MVLQKGRPLALWGAARAGELCRRGQVRRIRSSSLDRAYWIRVRATAKAEKAPRAVPWARPPRRRSWDCARARTPYQVKSQGLGQFVKFVRFSSRKSMCMSYPLPEQCGPGAKVGCVGVRRLEEPGPKAGSLVGLRLVALACRATAPCATSPHLLRSSPLLKRRCNNGSKCFAMAALALAARVRAVELLAAVGSVVCPPSEAVSAE